MDNVKHTPPTHHVQMLISSTQQHVWLTNMQFSTILGHNEINNTCSTDSYTAYIQKQFVGCIKCLHCDASYGCMFAACDKIHVQ